MTTKTDKGAGDAAGTTDTTAPAATGAKRYATRDFSDAGTGREFKKGDELTELTAGQLANYGAGGLVGDKPTEADKAADAATTT